MDTAMEDRDSATYSIESEPSQPTGKQISIDDVILPTVRRSAIQIVSQPLSPRRQTKKPPANGTGTIQITKLVLKTPPGSPKRQPKTPGIIIRSIQTLAGPALLGGSEHDRGTAKQKPSVLTDNRNVPDEAVPYTITPIVETSAKLTTSRKEFEIRRAERERTTNESQDFLRENFKENKTPPSTPPLPSTMEVTRIGGMGSSESESRSVAVVKNLTKPSIPIGGTTEIIVPPLQISTDQPAVGALDVPVSTPVPAARRSLLVAPQKPPDIVQPPAYSLPNEGGKRLEETSKEPEKFEPPLLEEQTSRATVEQMKPSRSIANRPKQPDHPLAKMDVNDAAKKKEKSYDPARAREFIREQQAKRRQEKKETPGSSGTAGSTKSASEKDLIKQRLETLRQSSQKLVSKNLQKTRNRSLSCAPKEEERVQKYQPIRRVPGGPHEHPPLRPSTAKPTTSNLRKFSSTPTLRLNKHPPPDDAKHKTPIKPPSSAGSIHVGSHHSSDASVHGKYQPTSIKTSSGPSSASSVKQPSTGGSKIGILRKPDSLALEDIVPFSPLKAAPLLQHSSMKPEQQQGSMVNAQLFVINAEQEVETSIAEAEKELKLDVPDVTLVPSNAVTLLPAHTASELPEKLENGPDDEEHHHGQPIKSIPPWLKQSLRQPDPYPFIVAVRKKLEAVRSARDGEEDGKRATQARGGEKIEQPEVRNTKSNAYLDAIESVPYIKVRQVLPSDERTGQDGKMKAPSLRQPSSDVFADGSVILTNISPYASSNTTSEISSIRTDIPPPMPPLLCSTRIEVPNRTALLPPSHTAPPASGPISPLSIDRISLMNIVTPSGTPRSPRSRIDRERELANSMTHVSRLNVPLTAPVLDTTINRTSDLAERSQKELEYQRLLESFNRSLTHVIEVNQQLYSALKNVPPPTPAPQVPQEVLRIRDEMTQTSQPVVVVPKNTVPEVMQLSVSKSDQLPPSRVAGSTTTASNYSDDFEHQSQTDGPKTPPERSVSAHTGNSPTSTPTESATSSQSSSTGDSSNSTTGSSSNSSTNSSSSSSSSSSSNEEMSGHNVQSQPTQAQTNRTNATDDERKRARTTSTTAQSSDFDSRSFSLSDSHNNTINNHPPLPEEYLPSFEESLRRRSKHTFTADNQEVRGREGGRSTRAQEVSRDASSISEQIDQANEERSFSFKHSEEMGELKGGDASLPQTAGTDESVDKSTLKDEQSYHHPVDLNADTTINSDLLAAMFNRTDLEVSILSATVSETNLSYSSIGMFDQLINSERSKEEQLVSRVHSKQKALLNRAKGQLAWLELQKQHYREKGMTENISGIRKKQRAILLRLEKDRAELNRTIKSSTETSQTTTTARTPLTSKNVESKLSSYCSSPVGATANSGSLTLRKSSSSMRSSHNQQHQSRTPGSPQHRQRRIAGSTMTTTTTTSNSIQIAIRGRELEPNDRLEDILHRREAELRKRKEHVQRLLEWHRKLEREEKELLEVEDKLLAYNSRKLERSNTSTTLQKDGSIEARVRSIEKSLKTLQSIPGGTVSRTAASRSIEASSANEVDPEVEVQEVVKTGGSKLNRLWYRLTGIREQRYEPGRNYQITRPHLEALYEDAKRCVLEGFQRHDGQLEEALLEQSIGGRKSAAGETTTTATVDSVEENVSLQTMIESEDMVHAVQQESDATPVVVQEPIVVPEVAQTTDSAATEPTGQEEPDGAEGELPNENDGKYLLSSTVNGWSPTSRRSIESVEFHTLEETGTNFQSIREASVGEEEPARSESYSTTFEELSTVEHNHPDDTKDRLTVGEESQPMIEDMSLPSMFLNNTSVSLDDEDTVSSSGESSATVELSFPLVKANDDDADEGSELLSKEIDEINPVGSDGSGSIGQSLEEASGTSVSACATTPTTITPTMAVEAIDEDILELQLEDADDEEKKEEEQEEVKKVVEELKLTPAEELEDTEEAGSDFELQEDEDVFQLKSSRASSRNHSPSSCASELEKRLATLHDELEELSETFERTPLMKSPTTPSTSKAKTSPEERTSTEETMTFEEDEEDDSGEVASPSGSTSKSDEDREKGTDSNSAMVVVAHVTDVAKLAANAATLEVLLRPKAATNESVPITAGSSGNNRDYPPPPPAPQQHGLPGGEVASGSSPPLSPSAAVVRMPDIINEAEVLRRQQLQIEQEIKELEQQVGFFREIPNKPPPPYIPPANGSPLALLFPCESRIDELIDGRVEELHRDRIAPERLRSDHVTNVYEKLILDMCKELYRELRPADPTVSFRTATHDKRPLVFYNPPDALRCMKDFLRAKVRRVLNEEQLALQQQHQQHHHQQQQQLLLHHHQLQQHQQQPHPQQHAQLQHHQHLLHHCATMPFLFSNGGCASKRKRDQVDEILAQEMHDDDARWTNFDREEIEVKDRITNELLKSLLADALNDMAEAYRSKRKAKERGEAAHVLESAM